jgi:hypothetical protein
VIVDAFHYPTAANDLNVFSTTLGLPAMLDCSTTNNVGSCFSQVFASGTQPRKNCGWAQEGCPGAKRQMLLCKIRYTKLGRCPRREIASPLILLPRDASCCGLVPGPSDPEAYETNPSKTASSGWIPSYTTDSGNRCYAAMAGDAKAAAPDRIWKFTTRNFAVKEVRIPSIT